MIRTADLPPLARSLLHELPRLKPPRLIANLWGTTTLGDCFAIARLIAEGSRLSIGEEIDLYEKAFAARIGVRHAISFASGRVAFHEILRSYGIGTGDEVLLQVPTHVVVANAVRFTGATPVFVDCERDTYNMDLAAAEAAVTPRTKAIVIQHTFGLPADMRTATALAERHGLFLIEDCVHALGSRFDGRLVGSIGHTAFFSTEETKTISSTMGGMAVTDDEAMAAKLRGFQREAEVPSAKLVRRYLVKQAVYHIFSHPLVHHFTRPAYLALRKHEGLHLAPSPTGQAEIAGGRPANYLMRLGNGQAIIAMRQLGRLDGILAHRKQVADDYVRLLKGSGIPLPRIPEGAEPAYVRFPVPVRDRDRVMTSLAREVVLGRWFDKVLEEAADPTVVGYQPGSCPNAEYLAKHLVNLPTHLRVRPKDTARLVADLLEADA